MKTYKYLLSFIKNNTFLQLIVFLCNNAPDFVNYGI